MNRHAVIVPSAIVGACNQTAITLGIDTAGEGNTLCIQLVPLAGADDAEVTHYGACGQMSEAARAQLETGFQANMFPGARWWRWHEISGELLASWDGQHIGEQWEWDRSLAAAQLKVRKGTAE